MSHRTSYSRWCHLVIAMPFFYEWFYQHLNLGGKNHENPNYNRCIWLHMVQVDTDGLIPKKNTLLRPDDTEGTLRVQMIFTAVCQFPTKLYFTRSFRSIFYGLWNYQWFKLARSTYYGFWIMMKWRLFVICVVVYRSRATILKIIWMHIFVGKWPV